MSKKIILSVLLAVVGFVTAVSATAASLNLSWSTPVTRTDGSALTQNELSGYELTLNGVVVGNPSASVSSFAYAITPGSCIKSTDVFAIRVKDTSGQWSVFSAPASVAVDTCTPKPAPTAPTLKVVVGP